ncbi:MAG: hypothetical protein HRT81_03205 [Henriciella sp.]|nr:hypothetical protein [Henriciella sp.]
MMKESEPLWFGPVALFVGIVVFFFGGIWLNFLVTETGLSWLSYARTISLTIAALLMLYGLTKIVKSGGSE